MIILNPHSVRFAGQLLAGVASLSFDRAAARLIEDRGDNGPYPEFIDVPEQRVTARIVQAIAATDVPGPELAAAGTLEVWFSSSRSEADRFRLFADGVITAIHYDLAPPSSRAALPPATRTITLSFTSPDGKADPLATIPADTGPD